MASFTLFSKMLARVGDGKADTTMTRSIPEYRTEYEYVYISYVKGLLFFENLGELCLNRTETALRGYFTDNAYKVADPQDLQASFEKACGRDFKGVFDAWLSGNVFLGG